MILQLKDTWDGFRRNLILTKFFEKVREPFCNEILYNKVIASGTNILT